MNSNLESAHDVAMSAKAAASRLAAADAGTRAGILYAAAEILRQNEPLISAANKRDVDASSRLIADGMLSTAAAARLKLDESKLADIINGINAIAAMPDLLGQISLERELDSGLTLYRVSCPIGVIVVVFESRPDALPQIASLCLKSGNAVILKGGREAQHSNRVLFECFAQALKSSGMPDGCAQLIDTREQVEELLSAEGWVDLIIPRGSNELVRYIQSNTRIPVLGHAAGVCHLFVDDAADLHKAIALTLDGKVQYPAACNSIETVLVHDGVAREYLTAVVPVLQAKGVEIRCDEASLRALANMESVSPNERTGNVPSSARLVVASEDDWGREYGDLILAFRVVPSLDEAITHINRYGSGHTDAIVTENPATAERFLIEVDSAGVFVNASTRFADGFRYGFGAEVGISTGKLHPRGPVGQEGLVTYKYKLVGTGQVVADYVGPNARKFAHVTLTPPNPDT